MVGFILTYYFGKLMRRTRACNVPVNDLQIRKTFAA